MGYQDWIFVIDDCIFKAMNNGDNFVCFSVKDEIAMSLMRWYSVLGYMTNIRLTDWKQAFNPEVQLVIGW